MGNKAASILSLAMKAGKLKSGEFLTEKAVKSGNAALVIIAEDASDNTKKMFKDMCSFYKVPFRIWGTKEELGSYIGRDYRACVALTDTGFKEVWLKQIEP